MAVNTYLEKVTKFLPQALDTVIVRESLTKIFEDGNKIPGVTFDPDTAIVKIPRLAIDGFGNYLAANNDAVTPANADYTHYRGSEGRDGYPIKGAEAGWEAFQLQWNRGVAIPFDKIDDMQEAGLFTAHLANEFARTKMVPEVDSLRISTIAGYASATVGNLVTEDPDALNDATGIIHCFNAGYAWLAKMSVAPKDQVILCTTKMYNLIRNTAELYKRLAQEDYKQGDVTFTISTYEGRPIIEVPDNYMVTDILASDNGVAISDTSKVINYIIVDKKSVMPFTFLKKAKIYGDETVGAQFDGYVFVCHLFHGLFVPRNKRISMYVSVSGTAVASSVANLLLLDLKSGANTNSWVMKAYYTVPAGSFGTVVYKSTAFTVGEAVTVGSGNTAVAEGAENVTAGLNNAYFALVRGGKAIAVSGQVTIPLKA